MIIPDIPDVLIEQVEVADETIRKRGSGSTQNASPFQVVTMEKEAQAYRVHKI